MIANSPVYTGEELDALIAVGIMGWKNLEWRKATTRCNNGNIVCHSPSGLYGEGPNREEYLTKHYSTNDGDALDVLKHLRGKYRVLLTSIGNMGGWQCSLEAMDGQLGDVF